MKYSHRVLRLRRKYISAVFMLLFLGLGLVVTFALNNQISKQSVNTKSKASYDVCKSSTGEQVYNDFGHICGTINSSIQSGPPNYAYIYNAPCELHCTNGNWCGVVGSSVKCVPNCGHDGEPQCHFLSPCISPAVPVAGGTCKNPSTPAPAAPCSISGQGCCSGAGGFYCFSPLSCSSQDGKGTCTGSSTGGRVPGSTNDYGCTNPSSGGGLDGTCIDTTKHGCSVSVVHNKCNAEGNNVLCCPGGTGNITNNPSSPGGGGGGSSPGGGAPAPVAPGAPAAPAPAPAGGSHPLSAIQDAQCAGHNPVGECQGGYSGVDSTDNGASCTLSNKAPGKVIINLCLSQPNPVRCCVATGAAPAAPAAPAANPPATNPGSGGGAAPVVINQGTPQASSSANLTISLNGIVVYATNSAQPITIQIFANGTPVATQAAITATGTVTYDAASGNFVNPNFNLGPIAPGVYQMVVQKNKYLDKQLLSKDNGSSFFALGTTNIVNVAPVSMLAGDVAPQPNGDNFINIVDYNALIGCMPGSPAGACLNKQFADLNDDGTVDQKDLDILLSNMGESGFSFQTDQFDCQPDPACGSGKDALQLCSLLCTKKTQRG